MQTGTAASVKISRPVIKASLGLAFASALVCATPITARAAEYGTGPWVKGYTDVLGGVVPPVPGLYIRNDAYHYEGSADRLIFDGRVNLGVDQSYMADFLALSYVTKLKILGNVIRGT